MSTPRRCFKGYVCTAVLTSLLVGCGGGGGGGIGSSSTGGTGGTGGTAGGGSGSTSGSGGTTDTTASKPGPDRNIALRVDASNFTSVSTEGLRAIETLLKLGAHATTEVALLARSGTLQLDSRCGGSAHYTLLDADGNGIPSAGDTVRIDYTACDLGYLGGPFNGSLIITLTSADDVLRGVMSGMIDFGTGLSSADRSQGNWFGTVNFRRTASPTREQLDITATSRDDLQRTIATTAGSAVPTQTDAYQHPTVSRVLDRQSARARVTGSLSFASDRLGGQLNVSLDPELSAYFNTYADAGVVQITGASQSRIRLPATAAGISTVEAELDTNGDGVAENTASLKWNSLYDGFLSSEQNAAFFGGLLQRDDNFLILISEPTFEQDKGVDLTQPLRLQFSRPVSPDTVLTARLVDHGSSLAALYGLAGNVLSDAWPFADADVEIDGAAVLIRPRTPLSYGHDYQLELSNVGDFQHAQAVTVRSASGSAQLNLDVLAAFFNSDDMLWAAVAGAGNRSVVLPNNAANVSANVPRATSFPLRYQWTQLSGPNLSLGTPTASSTTVKLAPGSAPGINRSLLELTVTDAIGRVSKAPVEMQVANLDGANPVLYFVSSPGDFIGSGQTRVYSAATGQFSFDTTLGHLSVHYADQDSSVWWDLDMRAANGGVPTVGTYNGAIGAGGVETGIPRLDFSGSGNSCGGNAANSFRIIELLMDGNGNVQRLAADFSEMCLQSNTAAPIRGSIRFNSSAPFPP